MHLYGVLQVDWLDAPKGLCLDRFKDCFQVCFREVRLKRTVSIETLDALLMSKTASISYAQTSAQKAALSPIGY